MDQITSIERSYGGMSNAIRTAYRALDPRQFDKAVRLLLRAPRIAASGCGQSAIACMYLTHLLCCIQRPARFLYPSDALHGGIGFLLSGDAMILASATGRTPELLEMEEVCRSKHVHVIAVTEDLSSPLARRADILLRLAIPEDLESRSVRDASHFALETVLFFALQNAMLGRMGVVYSLDTADRAPGTNDGYEPPCSCGPSD